MPEKIQIPAIETIKDFPVGNHKARIVEDRGHLRVIERHYYWSKVDQRGKEKREYIGYVVDGQYYTNEQYKESFTRNGKKRLRIKGASSGVAGAIRKIGSLDTRQAAEFPLYYAVARDSGLIEDLQRVWGVNAANALLSLAFHWLHTENNSVYLYPSWSPNKLLPWRGELTAKELGEFLQKLSSVPGWRKAFFGARADRLPEDEMLSYDATEIASEAQASLSQKGKGKQGTCQHQVGLIILVGHKSHMPVLYRILPGNITDVTTVPDMLFRFEELSDKRRVFAAVVDRGYFSLENIARFIDAKSRIVMAAKLDPAWIQDAMEQAMPHLWENSSRIPGKKCWGYTVPMKPEFEDGKERTAWVHVYRSDRKSDEETNAFYASLEEFERQWMEWKEPRPQTKRGKEQAKPKECPLLSSPLMKYFKKGVGVPGKSPLEQDDAAIDAAVRYCGMFCNVTTMECTAQQAIIQYRDRDLIEKTFKAGKSGFDLDVIRCHSDEAMEGRFIVSFVAMTILNEIMRRMNEGTVETLARGQKKELKPLAGEMSFNEMRNWLETPRVVFDGEGGMHWQEVTRRQHDIAKRLGYPDLYKIAPDWYN